MAQTVRLDIDFWEKNLFTKRNKKREECNNATSLRNSRETIRTITTK